MRGTADAVTIPHPRAGGLRAVAGRAAAGRAGAVRPRPCWRRAAIVATICLSSVPPPAHGRQVPADVLVQRLGSGSSIVRDQAERDLVAVGPAALPAVIAARDTASGETAFRLEVIQRHLEGRAAGQAVEPASVSVALRDVPARDALAAVFTQSSSTIELAAAVASGPAGDRLVSVAIDRGTFWEAVDAVLDRAGLSLEYGDRPPGLVIVDRPGPTDVAVAAGPLRVSVAGVEPTGPPPAADRPRPRGARVTLRVAWEPRLEPLLLRLPVRSVVAEGPAGEAVPPAQRLAVIEAAIPGGRPWLDLPLSLTAAATPLEALGMLRGTIVVWIAGLEHEFQWRSSGTDGGLPATTARGGATQRIAAAEVSLLEVVRQPGRLSVRTRVTYAAPSEALASHHTWLASRGVQACLPDGSPLDRIEQRVESRTEQGMTATASFATDPGGPSPAVLIRWRLPIAIHEVPIDFALRGVPLPAP